MSVIGDIINFIGGGGGSTSDKSGVSSQNQTGTVKDTSTTNTDQKQTSQTGSVSATKGTTVQSGKTVNQTLSDQAMQTGQMLLDSLAGTDVPDFSELSSRIKGNNVEAASGASVLLQRALGADSALSGTTDAIVANARKNAKDATSTQFTNSASQAGSAFSSAAQQVFAKATDDSETQLAALTATLTQQNRQQATTELLSALDEIQKVSGTMASTETAVPLALSNIQAQQANSGASILNALKGGLSTSDSTSTSVVDQRTETQSTTNTAIQSIVDQLSNKDINLNVNTATTNSDSTTNNRDLLDLLSALKD